MALNPYSSFKEWETDMDRIRAHPQDANLIEHVKSRVVASSLEIQSQVNEYLMDVQFVQNPIYLGQVLARKYNKVLFIRHPQDPWWYA